VKKYLDISAKVDKISCMLITNPLKKIFLLVGTGLLTVAANASTLTIDNFMQYDRAAKSSGSSIPASGATLPGGIQRELSIEGFPAGIVDLTASGGQLTSTSYNPSNGSSTDTSNRQLRINYSATTPLNLLLGGASAADMIMSLHYQTIPSLSVSFQFTSSSGSSAFWSLSRGSNSSGLISSSLSSINNSTFNWGSVNNIQINISALQGGLITLGNDNLGLRVAAVPEPSALSLLAFSLSGMAMMRRRRS
jgi:hypothetical protein